MEHLVTLYTAAFGVGTTLVLLVLLRLAQRVVSPSHTVARVFRSGNAARRFVQVGDVLAVFLLAAAVVKNSVQGASVRRDVLWVAAFGVAGLVLVEVIASLSARALFRAQLRAELDRGNAAAGIAVGAHIVATGILATRAVAGHDLRGLGLSLAFFAIAQVTHAGFVALFRALTTYDDAEQIQGGNVAAALSYAGV